MNETDKWKERERYEIEDFQAGIFLIFTRKLLASWVSTTA
jgi:hypothetical protein